MHSSRSRTSVMSRAMVAALIFGASFTVVPRNVRAFSTVFLPAVKRQRQSSLLFRQWASSASTDVATNEIVDGAAVGVLGSNDKNADVPLPTKKKVVTKRVLSGVQPTGSLHLGNYLGAIRQWVEFQNAPPTVDQETGNEIQTESFFCVVDLHAITMPHDPKDLQESTKASAALYLAAGIDPTKSKVFVQSHVSEHAELTWLLNCITPMNWLERMIQFKEKSRKAGGNNSEGVGVGLFTYPVLMAADILLYQADQVPVGEDQRQHLELARDIARRFHDMFCKGNAYKKRCKAAGIPSRPVFTEPNAMIVQEGARVMSLTDGTKKMSKSDANDASRINLLDPPKVIRDKIKRCKTDTIRGIEWDNPDRPEATNLLNIYHSVLPPKSRTKEEIIEEVKDMSWGDFKPILADAIVAHLEPIQKRYAEVQANQDYLDQVLREGADAAKAIASRTLYGSRVAMGFVAIPPSSTTSTTSSE